jgi:predicted deacylase
MKGNKEGYFITRKASDGKEYRIPVGVVTGAKPGSQITIYGGQHGTEYDGIEAVQRLYRTLDPEQVSGKIVISLATNEESLLDWQQFASTPPEIMDMMKELAEGSELLINCHGGEWSEGMCPYVICRLLGDDKLDKKSREMADVFGVSYVSFSQYRGEPPQQEGGERPAWWLWPKKGMADELKIPEITPEIGERASRGENGLMYKGLMNVLKHFNFLEGKPESNPKPKEIGDRYWITAKEQGMFHPEVDVCQDVVKDQHLGVVLDYFGNILQDVTAPAAAKVMNLNVGMPVKRNEFLLWLGVIDE